MKVDFLDVHTKLFCDSCNEDLQSKDIRCRWRECGLLCHKATVQERVMVTIKDEIKLKRKTVSLYMCQLVRGARAIKDGQAKMLGVRMAIKSLRDRIENGENCPAMQTALKEMKEVQNYRKGLMRGCDLSQRQIKHLLKSEQFALARLEKIQREARETYARACCK